MNTPARRSQPSKSGGGRGSGSGGASRGSGGSRQAGAGSGSGGGRQPAPYGGRSPGKSSGRSGGSGGSGSSGGAEQSAPNAGGRDWRDYDPFADPNEEGVRLQKVLAQAGVGSRRVSEDLIAAGRVEVNGEIVRHQGMRVDPETAVIRVDGMRISTAEGIVHFAFNKPVGVVSAMDDPDRPNLGDYVRGRNERLFHIGRLDVDTEGLILLTNDGELAHRLAHPSYEIRKVYRAQVYGTVPKDLGRRLREGVDLEDGLARVDHFRLLDSVGRNALVEITIHEGRNRIVRRIMDAVGLPVRGLVRTKFGPISLGDQKPERMRPLNKEEVGAIYKSVGL
ncbi:23S rRNA pseudouridine2605 synthase [Catenulispora sp. GP43]|uniref:pseudouridine synthase n=1 Tax=Catenulispora sp. GP43 TaxID=3156263 RepID=UPI003515B970